MESIAIVGIFDYKFDTKSSLAAPSDGAKRLSKYKIFFKLMEGGVIIPGQVGRFSYDIE